MSLLSGAILLRGGHGVMRRSGGLLAMIRSGMVLLGLRNYVRILSN